MSTGQRSRLHISIRGAVQGVGFRPFVFRLANDLGLTGWVLNSAQGVFMEVEGEKPRLETFLLRLEREKPPHSFIQSLEFSFLDPRGYESFEIRHSEESGGKTALVLPDIATCPECLQEVLDPTNRRFRYPFTNCTHCGPRFTIIEALPYDRSNTTMKRFEMCSECRREYEDPRDRRFHAQPNACPRCGPHLELWDEAGHVLATHQEALRQAAEAVRGGKILALKGLGGFHLIVEAGDEEAVQRLRRRKHREEKPLAIMAPSWEWVRAHCVVSELEERLLGSSESPIVLLQRKGPRATDGGNSQQEKPSVAPSVAPGNPYLGVMLPYTPLHHLLLQELQAPIVATSGNLSDEPICTDEQEALQRLRGIADLFLVHDRPIARHVDDSVVRVIMGRELVLRRARGYAPLPISLPGRAPGGQEEPASWPPVLAVGAHLKNTTALTTDRNVFLSQHIGDLETPQAFAAFKAVMASFQQLYAVHPQQVACDMHPEYLSTQFARQRGLPLAPVQHHHAHVVACMAENELQGPVLGCSWDGTGYGPDGTIWGGEFLRATEDSFQRVGHWRTFRLPGGEKAIREPRRTALGLLYEMWGEAAFDRNSWPPVQAFSASELRVLRTMLARGVNSPATSSVGRLFDAVASLVGLRQQVRFEGQAAMELEFALAEEDLEEAYPVGVGEWSGPEAPMVVDWEPLVRALLEEARQGVPVARLSAKFHNALVESIVAVAQWVGEERVVLTGGCFQNKYLTERAVHRLRAEGFRPYWHQRVPPNDGGIALGQAVAACYRIKEANRCV